MAAKRMELLRELLPTATRIAVLVNPANAEAGSTLRDVAAAARAMDLQIGVLNAGTSGEINAALRTFERERTDALLVGAGPPFNGRRVQLVQLATYYRIPAIYAGRQNVEIGGLMSYGANLTDAYRQLGVYAGRILKGAKPEDLPVQQPTKFELIINLKTAKALGLTVPLIMQMTANEVIE